MVEKQPPRGEYLELYTKGTLEMFHSKWTLEAFRTFIEEFNAGWMDKNSPLDLTPHEGFVHRTRISWHVRRKCGATHYRGGFGSIAAYHQECEGIRVKFDQYRFPDPDLFWEVMGEVIAKMRQRGFRPESDEPQVDSGAGAEQATAAEDETGKSCGPTARTQIRAEVSKRLKAAHPERTEEKLAMLFISYSRKDSEFAHRVADDLRTAGYSVWVDISELRGGQEWVREIDKAVRDCDTFILIISPDSMASRWVSKETLLAMDLEKQIVPVMWRETERPMHLVDIQYVEFRGAYDHAVQELYEALPPATFPPNYNPSPPSSTPSLPKSERLSSSP